MAFDNPHGFIPVSGASTIREYTVKAGNKVYKYDLVVTTVTEGTVVRAAADQDENLTPQIVGVAMHGADGDVSGSDVVAVETNMDRVYQVQADTTTWAATHIGAALDVKVGTTPTTIDDISQMEIDTVAASGPGGCCYLLGKVDGPEIGGGTNDYGTNVELLVKLRPLAMNQFIAT